MGYQPELRDASPTQGIYKAGPPLSSHRRPGSFRGHFGVVMDKYESCTNISFS
jgi:hypothetical protein